MLISIIQGRECHKTREWESYRHMHLRNCGHTNFFKGSIAETTDVALSECCNTLLLWPWRWVAEVSASGSERRATSYTFDSKQYPMVPKMVSRMVYVSVSSAVTVYILLSSGRKKDTCMESVYTSTGYSSPLVFPTVMFTNRITFAVKQEHLIFFTIHSLQPIVYILACLKYSTDNWRSSWVNKIPVVSLSVTCMVT